MSWAVELGPRAARDARKLDPAVRLQVLLDLQGLKTNPHPAAPKSKKLKGFKDPTYRLRSGEFRAVYRIVGRSVIIAAIFHRRDLDRELKTLA